MITSLRGSGIATTGFRAFVAQRVVKGSSIELHNFSNITTNLLLYPMLDWAWLSIITCYYMSRGRLSEAIILTSYVALNNYSYSFDRQQGFGMCKRARYDRMKG